MSYEPPKAPKCEGGEGCGKCERSSLMLVGSVVGALNELPCPAHYKAFVVVLAAFKLCYDETGNIGDTMSMINSFVARAEKSLAKVDKQTAAKTDDIIVAMMKG